MATFDPSNKEDRHLATGAVPPDSPSETELVAALRQAAKRRTPRERRRAIDRLSQRGFDQRQIAERLGVSQATISRDFKQLFANWNDKMRQEYQRLNKADAARVDRVEREIRELLDRLREPSVRTMRDPKTGRMVEVTTITNKPAKDRRCLKMLFQCAELRQELLRRHIEGVKACSPRRFQRAATRLEQAVAALVGRAASQPAGEEKTSPSAGASDRSTAEPAGSAAIPSPNPEDPRNDARESCAQ